MVDKEAWGYWKYKIINRPIGKLGFWGHIIGRLGRSVAEKRREIRSRFSRKKIELVSLVENQDGSKICESRTGAESGGREMYSSAEEEGRPMKYSRNEPMAQSARPFIGHRADIRDQKGRSLLGETIADAQGTEGDGPPGDDNVPGMEIDNDTRMDNATIKPMDNCAVQGRPYTG